MSTNRHTDIAAGAAATAANLNAPLGQLDAALNPAGVQNYDNVGTNTTCTLGSTFYAVTAYEVSVTPAFTGQAFIVGFTAGAIFANAAGQTLVKVNVTDGSNVTVTDSIMAFKTTAATTSAASLSMGGMRLWWAGAGDVGVVRKFKVYVSHSVAGTVVNMAFGLVTAYTH